MSYQHIDLTFDDGVAEIVLSRPEARNAMTPEMGDEIRGAVAELNRRDEVRVAIVHGAGKAFCAGGDLGMLETRAAGAPDANRVGMRDFYDRYLSIRRLRVPLIAAINGAAIGAGACFATACDIRYAAESAKIGFTFVKLGLHPGMGATHFLPRLVGPARAAELLLSGRIVTGADAVGLGLVNAAFPRDALLDEARRLARDIASAGPVAVAQTLESLRDPLARTLEQSLEGEARAQAIDYTTADLREGIAAVRDKRAPAFTGR